MFSYILRFIDIQVVYAIYLFKAHISHGMFPQVAAHFMNGHILNRFFFNENNVYVFHLFQSKRNKCKPQASETKHSGKEKTNIRYLLLLAHQS